MKKTITSFMLCGCMAAFAQAPSIGGTTIVPQSPTTNDNVMIITEVTTSYSGHKVSSSFHVNQNTMRIELKGCYYDGMLPALRTYIDTFMIGQIPAGNYDVDFVAQMTASASACVPIDSNTVSMDLTVASVTGIKNSQQVPNLRIYPVPATDKLFIEASGGFTKAAILSPDGKLIRESVLTDSPLDIHELAPGIYFLKLTSIKTEVFGRFVKSGAH